MPVAWGGPSRLRRSARARDVQCADLLSGWTFSARPACEGTLLPAPRLAICKCLGYKQGTTCSPPVRPQVAHVRHCLHPMHRPGRLRTMGFRTGATFATRRSGVRIPLAPHHHALAGMVGGRCSDMTGVTDGALWRATFGVAARRLAATWVEAVVMRAIAVRRCRPSGAGRRPGLSAAPKSAERNPEHRGHSSRSGLRRPFTPASSSRLLTVTSL